MPVTTEPEILTTKELAERLRVTTNCIRVWRENGTIPTYLDNTDDGGKTIRYVWKDVCDALGITKRLEETEKRLAAQG